MEETFQKYKTLLNIGAQKMQKNSKPNFANILSLSIFLKFRNGYWSLWC